MVLNISCFVALGVICRYLIDAIILAVRIVYCYLYHLIELTDGTFRANFDQSSKIFCEADSMNEMLLSQSAPM